MTTEILIYKSNIKNTKKFNKNYLYNILDYQAMNKARIILFKDELIAKAFHPSRVAKWMDYHCENGGDIDDFEM